MTLEDLKTMDPWEWGEGAAATLLEVISDRAAAPEDRQVAIGMAAETVVIDDALVAALLAVARDPAEAEELRAAALIALGPALEEIDTEVYGPGEELVSRESFDAIQAALQTLHADAAVPLRVRRAALEAAVRAPQDWQKDAVRAALASGSRELRLSGVFAARFVDGFDREIVAALETDDEAILYEAVCAAGAWGIEDAWARIVPLIGDWTDKDLLLAAIDAVAAIRPEEAIDVLGPLLESDDEDVVLAVSDVLALAEAELDNDDEGDDTLADEDDKERRETP